MIDWHSHILPGMDDGSKSVAESVSMINIQASQGVKTVIATPHFYANDESVDSFLERREKSFKELKNGLPQNSPKIILGAEVKYYQGISRMAQLKALRVEGSKALLLEMPMAYWTEYMVGELIELAGRNSVQIILAHIDRYIKNQKRGVLERIIDSGILMQANASYFTSIISRNKAITHLKKGNIHFIGSDCHNITSRAPQFSKAVDIIKKKLGQDCIGQMNEYGYYMLEKSQK